MGGWNLETVPEGTKVKTTVIQKKEEKKVRPLFQGHP